jgi:hypothetical protein
MVGGGKGLDWQTTYTNDHAGLLLLLVFKQVTTLTTHSTVQVRQQRTWPTPHAAVPRAAVLLLPPPLGLPQHAACPLLQMQQQPPASCLCKDKKTQRQESKSVLKSCCNEA